MKSLVKLPTVGLRSSELGEMLQDKLPDNLSSTVVLEDALQYLAFTQAHYIMGVLYEQLALDTPDIDVKYYIGKDATFVYFDADTLPSIDDPKIEYLLKVVNTFYGRDVLHHVINKYLEPGQTIDDLPDTYGECSFYLITDIITILLAAIAIGNNTGFSRIDNPNIVATSIDMLGFIPFAKENKLIEQYIAKIE